MTGIINGNEIEFSGNFKMLFAKIKYKAVAKMEEDKIWIIASTNKGNFEIQGIKE